MGDYNALRSQDIMTASIYSFLENLLAAVRTSETLASEGNERDQINVPSDIKPGGYSEDIFIFLSEREKEEYTCSVCYSVIKDVHQCSNGHKFCYSCIYVWSACNRTGADCCPACRCEGVYARNEQLNEKIGSKRVKCQDDGCNWRGFLRDYGEHEHRHYEFKELSRSVEIPNFKNNEIPQVVSPPPLLPPESIDVDKTLVETRETRTDFISPITSLTTNDTGIINSARSTVSRTNMAPRRLSRLSDATANPVRTNASRQTLNNYSRLSNITTARCPNYRHGTNYPPRPPRMTRINRSNDSLTPPHETYANINHNESTQTNNGADNRQESNHSPIMSSLLDLSRQEATEPLPRPIGLNREPRSPLFPAINSANRHNLSTERQTMEYRRLAPTYASRRHNMGFMNDGREHLATMLILLTSDLEDRITLRSQSRDNLANAHSRTINNTTVPLSASSELNLASATNDTDEFVPRHNRMGSTRDNNNNNNNTVGRSTSRLQEFRNLNRRLSEVANSLDILIESTTRQGELISTARSSSHSNDSSLSNNTTDTED